LQLPVSSELRQPYHGSGKYAGGGISDGYEPSRVRCGRLGRPPDNHHGWGFVCFANFGTWEIWLPSRVGLDLLGPSGVAPAGGTLYWALLIDLGYLLLRFTLSFTSLHDTGRTELHQKP
jgi:hypothetical protein